MKFKALILTLLVTFAITVNLSAQKIGYANIQLAAAYMPETKSMDQMLQTYQKKLSEQLQVKQSYAQQKYQEYVDLKEKNAPATATEPLEKELAKLQQELEADAAASEDKLMRKRQELMEPILNKLQNSMEEIAKELGYDMILNTTDGAGMSIILFGPEEDDLTKRLLTKLGIEVPNQ